ncbi:MAG: hypothetical protein KBD01_14940 [Acidobacteria bacterium]|nr:hypothetical protein [Acidobacteriota bacterium]
MEVGAPVYRYEMVNVRPGYIIVEHEIFSRRMRSFFSDEPAPPVEEYREGKEVWKFSAMAQSFQFDLKDRESGGVVRFDDLLGLVPHTGCRADSDLHRIGQLAQQQRIWVYVAITHQPLDGARAADLAARLEALNVYFNERLQTPNKKILILPDSFGLYNEFSQGQVLADFGLTSLE